MMTQFYQSFGACVLSLTLGILALPPALAKDPPATTYTPGFWQPVERFNSAKPVSIKLINNSGLDLDYDITTLESFSPATLKSGESSVLSGFGDSTYVMVYPAQSYSTDTPFTLRFVATVDETTNQVSVTVDKADKNFLGHRTINLQTTGAIYFY